MEFSEANGLWRDIPRWASFLIDFGFGWLADPSVPRRIAVVSMPSESAAAGLISLGAMRKCLELDEANDLDSHFQRILKVVRLGSEAIRLRHITGRDQFFPDGVDTEGNPWVRNVKRPANRRRIRQQQAIDWRFDGEAPVVIQNGNQVPNSEIYLQLVKNGGEIRPANLSATDSGICLASSVVGGTSTRNRMSDIRFRQNGCEADLCQLLTVQNWMPGTISRVMFFNSRTEEFDRSTRRPQVVVADGDNSFLKLIDRAEFENSDVIGIIHRTMERERLEAVGTRLASLRQWYDPDSSAFDKMPEVPRGVAISVLRRRM
jgi:hypothetical protein